LKQKKWRDREQSLESDIENLQGQLENKTRLVEGFGTQMQGFFMDESNRVALMEEELAELKLSCDKLR
jgi:hypothetical protein